MIRMPDQQLTTRKSSRKFQMPEVSDEGAAWIMTFASAAESVESRAATDRAAR
jgi:hypothetical protein